MQLRTNDPRLLELARFYPTPSRVRTELEALRDRFSRLETEEQRQQNRTDRADLNRLLLVMS